MNTSTRGAAALLLAAASVPAAATARAQDKPANNGTDPTKLTTIAQPTCEHLDLVGGFGSAVLRLNSTQPFGEKSDYSLRLRVPVQVNDVLGNSGHDLGDASVMLAHVFGLTRTHGWVGRGEAVFGGVGIVAVKPTLLAGGDRPADWGIEVGYKLPGF